ncbi:uncharacterized protein PV09_00782 [Verruconis gallopava]|uniref:Rhodanese domain-containing protein n=1 Tax=Verruconis gallopava TaxID=253628 RepID=A0A0D2AQA8_9PEZI|nr:uncharacterized protein PV09_00782 [Verruconis gallopava]KIW08858.1 hypothetical protein PV09_00782 [Verruconis gallopava]
MALPRIFSRALREAAPTISSRAFHVARTVPARSKWHISLPRRLPGVASPTQRRYSSDPAQQKELPPSKTYDFSKVKDVVLSTSEDKPVLIDVREPHEFAAGSIPGAINIPVQSQPDALFLSPDAFEDRFGIPKPPPEREVVFYCKAGVRGKAAAHFAKQNGYQAVGEYPGSWLDWVKNGGEQIKP